ncbi:hypothetical protein Golob_007735 [Gossypium lobatum]|uniref:DUF4283 domain-containing protein n=1 Tax=Gossypium lobatum TaxID=34289 RepID=A0A7J8MDP7_9ROSI|nr:hypothetical protein [Gossypium lobatum]
MIIHDLPLGFMSKAIAKQLGSFIGVFLEYDTSTTQLGYKRIIRINVRIDVRKPLKRKKNLPSRMVSRFMFDLSMKNSLYFVSFVVK